MRSGSGEIRVAGAPESPKVMIGRVSAIECEGSAHVQRFGGEARWVAVASASAQ